MRPDIIAFDLDGTLIDSLAGLTTAVNAARAASGLAAVVDSQVERWIGRGTRVLVTQALSDGGGDGSLPSEQAINQAHEVFVTAYSTACDEGSRLRPGAKACLELARDHGVPCAITTNKLERFARRIAAHLGIDGLTAVILGGDSGERKPSPWMLHEAARRCGVHSARGLLIGDSLIDVETARAAGWPVWIVRGGYGTPTGIPLTDSLEVAHQRLSRLLSADPDEAHADEAQAD